MAARNYRVVLTTIGPVHIGTGRQYKKKDYFLNGREGVSVLDVPKFLELLDEKQLEDYCDFLQPDSKKAQRDSKEGLQDFLDRQENREIKKRIGQAVLYSVKAKLTRSKEGSYQYFDVFEFVKDAYGNPYIPGSSVKGMLRTALLSNIVLDNQTFYQEHFDRETARSPQKHKTAGQNIEKEAFWREKPDTDDSTIVNDIMRYVSVSDSDPLSVRDLAFVKKYDLFSRDDSADHKLSANARGNRRGNENNRGNELNIYRECLTPGVDITLTLSIDERIDRYFGGDQFNALKLKDVLDRFMNLYRECFLSKFDFEDEAGGLASTEVDDGMCRYVYSSGPVAGQRCRNHAVGDTGYCNSHKAEAQKVSENAESLCYLGGGVGFANKTVMNALFDDDVERVDEIARILYAQFPSSVSSSGRARFLERGIRAARFEPKDRSKKEDHRHWRDPELRVSPHTLKLGIIGDKKYPMGKCRVRIEDLL